MSAFIIIDVCHSELGFRLLGCSFADVPYCFAVGVVSCNDYEENLIILVSKGIDLVRKMMLMYGTRYFDKSCVLVFCYVRYFIFIWKPCFL